MATMTNRVCAGASARFRQPLLVGGMLLGLGACGGGGSSTAPAPVNSPPSAQASAPATASAGERVSLDASASRDSDGTIIGYGWTQTEGSSVDLQNADSAAASFTAPSFGEDRELIFTVTVEDDDGARSSASVAVTVLATELAAEVNISGRILPALSQSLDGDTNDPLNRLVDNSSSLNPQTIANPVTLGGYVNEPGAGAEGRSQISGDREDFFRVELLEGQRINLLVAEFQDADADLYLYSDRGELVDFSIETGELESIAVPNSGDYLVNVSIFRGATNYTLTIGSSLTPVALGSHRDLIPGQVVVDYEEENTRLRLARQMHMRQLGGGPRRERLMALEPENQDTTVLGLRLGNQRYRKSQFADAELAARWDTLMSIKHLAQTPGVRSVEANYRVRPTATVNDEIYGFQWHYPLINVPGAWDSSVGDPAVIVAVIDTGILSGHPDLQGQLVPGYDFIRDAGEAADGDGIDPNPEETIGGLDPAAINFHGTHVAGTVAARGNNGIGVAGVAFGARIMPLRAITASGGTSYDVNQAVRFAAGLSNDSGTLPAEAASVINLSLAGSGFSAITQSLYNDLHARGIVLVASAGNENTSAPSYPASYDNVISVSAVDSQQRITPYSNFGAAVDLAAPGGDGSVDLNGDGYPDGVLSTGASDGEFAYTFLSGTSMAAPHVAGVVALMRSVNPQLNARDIHRLLESGAMSDDFGTAGRDNRYGYGIVNARKAIDAALAEAGGSFNSEPRLSSSSSALNFGPSLTRLEMRLSNGGGGELSDVRVESSDAWIAIETLNVDDAGLGRYTIRVDRSRLAPGVYEGSVLASSSANSLSIRIIASVSSAGASDLGQIYLLLYDPVADEVVAQAEIVADSQGYRFRLPPVPAGNYLFFSGSDLDNDLLICDPGEACGSYLTIDQPLTVTIDRDRSDIDFPIEYLIALPGAAATASDGAADGLPTLRRSGRQQ